MDVEMNSAHLLPASSTSPPVYVAQYVFSLTLDPLAREFFFLSFFFFFFTKFALIV